jgi:hypothetical protein
MDVLTRNPIVIQGDVMSNADNGVVNYSAQLALSPVRNNPLDDDNFYPADGDSDYYNLSDEFEFTDIDNSAEAFDFASGEDDYYNLLSRKERRGNRKRRQKRRQQRQDARLKRKELRTQSKADARRGRVDAKKMQAESQRLAAQNFGKESQSDIELAKALQTPGSTARTTESKGLSTGAIIGIALGGLALLGLGVYFVMKSKNKGK